MPCVSFPFVLNLEKYMGVVPCVKLSSLQIVYLCCPVIETMVQYLGALSLYLAPSL